MNSPLSSSREFSGPQYHHTALKVTENQTLHTYQASWPGQSTTSQGLLFFFFFTQTEMRRAVCNQLRETDPSAMSDLFFNLSVKAYLCCGEAATLNAKEIGLFFIWCCANIVQSVQRNTHINVYHILKENITRKGIGMGHLLVSWGPRSWQELFHVMWMTKWDLYRAGLLHSYSELAQLDLGLGNVNKLPWVAALVEMGSVYQSNISYYTLCPGFWWN